MTFTVTVQPSGVSFSVDRDEPILTAAIRQGIGLPYGCRDGACGSCKCRLIEGRVIHGTHQAKALSPAEEEAGFTLTCRAAAQTDVTLEARTVAGAGEFAVRKMPCRVTKITKPTHDVAVLQLQLPANDALQYRAGQYIEFILKDGHRRSYSMANAPGTQSDKPGIELHIRHMPGGVFTDHVFSAMKEKEILRLEGPFGSFFLREDSDKPIVLLASGTGFAPVKAIIEHMRHKAITRPTVLYWGCRAKADLYMHEWCVEAAKTPAQPALRAGAFRTASARRLGRPHWLCPPGGDGRFPRPRRPSGLCLRRPGDGGHGTARFRRALQSAAGRVLCRQLHLGSRQARSVKRRNARRAGLTLRGRPRAPWGR